jgi:hypothetical protein
MNVDYIEDINVNGRCCEYFLGERLEYQEDLEWSGTTYITMDEISYWTDYWCAIFNTKTINPLWL